MTTALEGVEGSASRPGRSLPPGKTRYPLYRRLGGLLGPSGQVRKILPHRDSIPGPSSPSLYRLRYPAHSVAVTIHKSDTCWYQLYSSQWPNDHIPKHWPFLLNHPLLGPYIRPSVHGEAVVNSISLDRVSISPQRETCLVCSARMWSCGTTRPALW